MVIAVVRMGGNQKCTQTELHVGKSYARRIQYLWIFRNVMFLLWSVIFDIEIAIIHVDWTGVMIIHVDWTGSYDQSLFVRHLFLCNQTGELVCVKGHGISSYIWDFQSESVFHVSNHSVSGWQGIELRI